MTAPATPRSIHPADVRGLSRMGADAVLGVTDLVEQLHHTIVSRAGIVGAAPPGRTRGITGFVYRAVRGSTRLVGRGLDAALARLLPDGAPESTPERDAVIAALNGVWGDHLAATGNPLAIPMALRVDGCPIGMSRDALAAALPEAGGRVVVLLHGLCMNDLQWSRQGHDHGRALARDLGFTPLRLHYNTGLHVSHNGRAFAELLEQALAHWPVPVTELVLIGHSMGGLVARSACHVAESSGLRWRASLSRLVCLGTPHHGASIERGGHRLDMLFGISPYAAPFARLGKARSAGITDLRFGNLRDADWQGRDRHDQRRDDRRPTPLPAGVDVHLVAATTAAQPAGLRHALLGDGLVTLASAWGEHREPGLALRVPRTHRQLVTSASHWDLLSHPEVYAQLRQWLAAPGRPAAGKTGASGAH